MTDLDDFANRLAKNARHLRRWARRNDVHAYRLYDCDVPEFPLIVEVFETGVDDGETTTYLRVDEVDTGWQQSPQDHDEWIAHVVEVAATTLDVPPERCVVKRRARQRVKGDKTDQHQATGEDGPDLVVREGGLRFLVNLEGYLDTGLFLDHRPTRALVGASAAGKRFLNLFAYTGSFTVHAAARGALSSESVDLSNTYCDWARRNLERNGVAGDAHRVIRDDVFTWLRDAVGAFEAGDRDGVDLIVLDPPTFSNSRAMQGVLDVQRDHPWLLRQCLALLAPGGEMYFSTNLRTFELDALVQERGVFTEISHRTVPEDFRDRRIHRCWHVRRRGAGA